MIFTDLMLHFSCISGIFKSSFYTLSEVPLEIRQVYAYSLENDAVLLTAATQLTRVKIQLKNMWHGRNDYSFTPVLYLRRYLSIYVNILEKKELKLLKLHPENSKEHHF